MPSNKLCFSCADFYGIQNHLTHLLTILKCVIPVVLSQILQCIICMYLHIYSVRNTTMNRWYHYVIYITVQYTTTCFGLINGPSSGCWQNLWEVYTLGVWGGRDLVLHYLVGYQVVNITHDKWLSCRKFWCISQTQLLR